MGTNEIIKYLEGLSDSDRSNLMALVDLGADKIRPLVEEAKSTGNSDNICFTTVALLLSLVKKD